MVCTKHQTSADYVCLNCNHKWVCVYCKYRDHKGHFVRSMLQQQQQQQQRCSRSVRGLTEEMERVGVGVVDHRFLTVAQCERKLREEMANRKAKCLVDYERFLEREEGKVMTKLRNESSLFDLLNGSCNDQGNKTQHQKPLLNITLGSFDLHNIGSLKIKIDNTMDQNMDDNCRINLHMRETESCSEPKRTAIDVADGNESQGDTKRQHSEDLMKGTDVVVVAKRLVEKVISDVLCELANECVTDHQLESCDDVEEVKGTIDDCGAYDNKTKPMAIVRGQKLKENLPTDYDEKTGSTHDAPLLNPKAVPVFFPSKTSTSLCSKLPTTATSTAIPTTATSTATTAMPTLNPDATPVFYPTKPTNTTVAVKDDEKPQVADSTSDPSLVRFLAAASANCINTDKYYEEGYQLYDGEDDVLYYDGEANEDEICHPPETPLSSDPTMALFLERVAAYTSCKSETDLSLTVDPVVVFLERAKKLAWSAD